MGLHTDIGITKKSVELWENDGFLLLYKRMEAQGRFRWPRNSDEVKTLTWQQFDWLMSGLEIEQPKAFRVPENTGRIPSV